MAEAVCMAESHCRPEAVGYNQDGSRDYGIFQINSIHAGRVNGNVQMLLDPETNVRVAAEIYREQGWTPWVTFKTGKYKQYLK